MSTLTLPDWLQAQTLAPPMIQRATLASTGRYSGATAVGDLMSGDTWTMSLGLPASKLRNSGRVEAFVNQLVGGVNLLQCHHLARPLPQGSMRGATTLAASASLGASALQIAGATALPNLLRGAGFEVDSNADGVGDGWAPYSFGSFGTPAYVLGNPYAWGNAQVIQSSALGTTDADRVGVVQSGIPVAAYVGATITYSAFLTTYSGALRGRLFLRFFDSGGAAIAGDLDSGALTPPTYTASQRYSISGTVPAGAVTCTAWAWQQQGDGGPNAMGVDGAQLEIGALTPYSPLPPLLLAGDMLGVGNALFQVAADTYLNDAGAGTVPVVNRVRSTLASGSAVIWNKPTALWRLVGRPQPMLQPGSAAALQLDLVEKAF